MSTEDVIAREDARKFVDSHQPMALDTQDSPPPLAPETPVRGSYKALGGPKPASCRKGYLKARKLAERENRKRAAAIARETKKNQKLEDARLLKEAKLREAEGRIMTLPCLVSRNPAGGPPAVTEISNADAVEVLSLYLDDMYLDVEHSGYPFGHRHYFLKTVQLGGEGMAVVFDKTDEMSREVIRWALRNAKKLHAHSAVADVVPCVLDELAGWDIWERMEDSVLRAKLTDPKMSGSDANALKELSRDLLRDYATAPEAEKAKNALFRAIGCKVEVKPTTPPEENGWHQVNINSEVMIRYAGSDVLDLAAVVRVLPPLPVDEAVLDREREFEEFCAEITRDGFALDRDHIKAKIEEHEAEKAEHRQNVEILSRGTITNPSSSSGADNVGPCLVALYPHLGPMLAHSEKTGEPSASKNSLANVFAKLDEKSEEYVLCKEILAYRHNVTTLGLLLRKMETLCDEGDGRVRPTVYTINADTGRTSCAGDLNGQQLSRQGGIRKCIVADPGDVKLDADFEGCEIRVAAGLSGDHALLEAEMSSMCYRCESDPCECGKGHTGLHWLAAHLTFGKEAVKENRYKCKAVIFRKLFGGSPDSPVAEKIAEVFDTQIAPEYAAWDKWLRQSYYDGYMVWRDYEKGENFRQKLDGKRRGIYRTYNGRNIYVKAPHAFGNYAIQGTARELLVDGCLKWKAEVARHPEWGVKAAFPVHDQIVSWCKAEYFTEATAALKRCMESDVLSVPGWRVYIGADPETTPYTYWNDSS